MIIDIIISDEVIRSETAFNIKRLFKSKKRVLFSFSINRGLMEYNDVL